MMEDGICVDFGTCSWVSVLGGLHEWLVVSGLWDECKLCVCGGCSSCFALS